MSIDWTVRFPQGEPPARKKLRQLIEDFLGGDAEAVEDTTSWDFIVTLHGDPSSACRRIFPKAMVSHPRPYRQFELIRCPAATIVTTRQQDEYTMVVAAGLAECVSRVFRGELESPS